MRKCLCLAGWTETGIVGLVGGMGCIYKKFKGVWQNERFFSKHMEA